METSDKNKYSNISPNYKLWLTSDDGKNFMGDGKWLLLKAIDEKGSLKAATKELNISYRKAWGDLKKTEIFLGFELTEKHRGGKNGGKSMLTDKGKKLINAYQKFHTDIDNYIEKSFNKFLTSLNI